MTAYVQDQELANLAATIIKAHRPILAMLKIAYLFREEATVTPDGKVVAGMAIRVDDRAWTLHRHDAMIEIARDVWLDATDEFKQALMDHELGHISIGMDEGRQPIIDEKTGRLKVRMKGHDLEEFDEVLERHGAYHKSLRNFLEAFAKHKQAKKKKAGDDFLT